MNLNLDTRVGEMRKINLYADALVTACGAYVATEPGRTVQESTVDEAIELAIQMVHQSADEFKKVFMV